MPTNSSFGSGHEVVTSTTRPAAPTTGQLIYETDTKVFSWYTGSAWSGLIPVGTINAYPSATAPTGWLICNGQEISQSTYANLYSVIGSAYNTQGYNLAAPSAGNFRVPDLRGVRPAGMDNMGGSSAGRVTYPFGAGTPALGAYMGSQYLGSHTHTYSGSGTTGVDDPDHGHSWGLSYTQGGRDGNDTPARSMYGWDGNFRTGWRSSGSNYGGATDRPHTHNLQWFGNTASTQSGGSANMPPTMMLTYIIKH